MTRKPATSAGSACWRTRFVEAGVGIVEAQPRRLGSAPEPEGRPRTARAAPVDKTDRRPAHRPKAARPFEDTLVIWGGEFGRTPHAQERRRTRPQQQGHSLWMAGGGVKPGLSIGPTDDFGYEAVEKPLHVHDWHATICISSGSITNGSLPLCRPRDAADGRERQGPQRGDRIGDAVPSFGSVRNGWGDFFSRWFAHSLRQPPKRVIPAAIELANSRLAAEPDHGTDGDARPGMRVVQRYRDFVLKSDGPQAPPAGIPIQIYVVKLIEGFKVPVRPEWFGVGSRGRGCRNSCPLNRRTSSSRIAFLPSQVTRFRC